MSFKLKSFYVCALSVCLFFASTIVGAAEWKSEPSVFFKGQYNDNPRLRTNDIKKASTGFTLEPRIKFAGEEQQLWDMAIDTRAKITRFQDIEDADSENLFFKFNGGRQTELTDWRLNTNYSKNTNFDTDFDTANPTFGIGDRTERTTLTVAPSVSWSTSEISRISLSLNTTQVTYDEVRDLRLRDYNNDSLSFNAFWMLTENNKLGFTSSYTEYDSPETNFSYDQTVLQLDYTYTISPASNISVSLGTRSLDTLRSVTTCVIAGGGSFLPPNGQCPDSPLITPVIEDVSNEDTGTVSNIAYTNQSELASHRFTGGRTISPSSFGGANETRNATYQFSIKNTERLTTKLILDAAEIVTVNGTLASRFNDRTTYRVEPSISYQLTKNWKLQFLYRYINRDYVNRGLASETVSNAIFINLFLNWPKLVTTY